MPKKRFSPQYSKPQSTVHPSLDSGSSSSSKGNDAPPSVNDLIASFRKLQSTTEKPRSVAVPTSRTLPPQIRNLLSLPETPAPPRRGYRRRFDENGRLLPPGPSAPRSWSESSKPQAITTRIRGNICPSDIDHLPSLDPVQSRQRHGAEVPIKAPGKRLQDICLRAMAANWKFVASWERNNLAYLPTQLRMSLLSHIAVYGPEEGVTIHELKTLLVPPTEDNDIVRFNPGEYNDGFYRLDLSGSVGRSISLKQISELVQAPESVEQDMEDWEVAITRTLSSPIPLLTHLSLSHPSPTISWRSLIQFSKHVPTLTHLSLAFWPTPSLTPNSKAAVMSGGPGRDVQYAATSFYSHSLDNDYREAANLLRNLANKLYSLEYLDLTGCTHWIRALRWQEAEDGIDWGSQWLKMRELKLYSGISLSEDSSYHLVDCYMNAVVEGMAIQKMMPQVRRKGPKLAAWVEVLRDDYKDYEGYWKRTGERDIRRNRLLQVDDLVDEWQLTSWQRSEIDQRTAAPELDTW